ncbi:MAG: hypothetical protein PHV55_00525 [Candidatus Omnitrophica bacterium]|nr:hypothetical protein [Candidatus Omnitrophota bacterium]
MNAQLQNLHGDFKVILAQLSALAQSRGFRIYIVGGVVRDLLLRKNIFDLDCVVEGDAIALATSFAHDVRKEFKKHHAFGTATVYYDRHTIDFATARRETYSSWGVLPRVFPANLEEDLLRRDFTINAMAISLNKNDYGTLIDYYGGLADLRKGVIRVLHDKSFLDDPTRLLRAVRFCKRFSFAIEKNTALWAHEAVRKDALSFVHPHRLRDELILILKEPSPAGCIRKIDRLIGFSFIDKTLTLGEGDYRIMRRLAHTIDFYKKSFTHCRKLDEWVMYFAAVLHTLPIKRIKEVLRVFDFRKGDRVRVFSAKEYIFKVTRLAKPLKPHSVYRILNELSFETILFLYAYHTDARIRASIEYFFNTLAHVRLKVKGDDLQRLGVKPQTLYGTILKKLFDTTLDMHLSTKEEEMRRVRLIAKKIQSKRVRHT